MKLKKWRPAIPSPLSLLCPYCKRIPEIDYHINNKIWKLVVPKKFRLGVVCLRCFILLANKRKINWIPYLEKVFLSTDSVVIEFKIVSLWEVPKITKEKK
ncbi:unnamed protein product [marine sediment metagenome]|uniref:Uncharacterized protein n=1 Tax=marine sediment metagenome TaxID=412755 RepID=X1S204_9ZZZZ